MANTTGSGRTQADKERSKQMSRSVTANQAGRKNAKTGKPNAPTAKAQGGPRRSAQGGSGKPPNRGSGQANRGGAGGSPNRSSRRSPTALLTWGTAGLVIVIVIVLVAVKVFGGSTPASGPVQTPASPAVVAEVTGVPASVFDTVGVTSAVAPIYPPIVITGQKPLTFADTSGKTLPGVFFFGAEYCPHCAAERWAIIVALSRFGTFHNLGNMQSSSSDVDPNTQTFTFHGATYTSKYFVFKTDEYESNELNAAGTEYTILEQPTKVEAKLVDKYNTSTYFPSLSAGELSFPFLDFGNKVLSEENYDPGILAGLTREEIASGLKSAKNPITQAIVASANYLSAAVCNVDGQLPATVCTSKGVTAAAKALKLS
jgi:Domain of unknown function (DUF929)